MLQTPAPQKTLVQQKIRVRRKTLARRIHAQLKIRVGPETHVQQRIPVVADRGSLVEML